MNNIGEIISNYSMDWKPMNTSTLRFKQFIIVRGFIHHFMPKLNAHKNHDGRSCPMLFHIVVPLFMDNLRNSIIDRHCESP